MTGNSGALPHTPRFIRRGLTGETENSEPQSAASPYKPRQASGRSPALPWLCRKNSMNNALENYAIYTVQHTLPIMGSM